jgi:uncharacterized membrane protein YfcA
LFDLLVPALLVLGVLCIILNTVLGGGGGAVLVPALILLFNHSTNAAIATSFVTIAVGAIVSTFAYSRQGRVDYGLGLILGALTIPGTILGAFIASSIQGPIFQLSLGIVIVLVAFLPLTMTQVAPTQSKGGWTRKLTDAFGTEFSYTVRIRVAILSALATGFVGGTFGAAGALVLTPGMLIAGFPIHIALATARLVALVLSLTGSVTRLYLGQVDFTLTPWLSVGAVIGGFAGARLARVLKSDFLRKIVSFGISLLGLALILRSVL